MIADLWHTSAPRPVNTQDRDTPGNSEATIGVGSFEDEFVADTGAFRAKSDIRREEGRRQVHHSTGAPSSVSRLCLRRTWVSFNF